MRLVTTARDPFRLTTLDELWAEAETLGCLNIDTDENYRDGQPKGYKATLYCRVRDNRVTIRRDNRSLQCAIADAITEAREMGAGVQP